MLYDLKDSDATGITDAVLLQSPRHGRRGHPGRVVATVVPRPAQRLVVVFDGDHLPNVNQNLDDHLVPLGVTDGIAASFLLVPAEVNARAQYSIWRWTETPDLDGCSVPARRAVVHDISSVADHLGGELGNHAMGQFGNIPF